MARTIDPLGLSPKALYFLLCYATDLYDPRDDLLMGDEDFTLPMELFFRALSEASAGILRRGPERVYKNRVLVGPNVIGRLDCGATIAVDLGRWRESVSVQAQLSPETPQNTVIKTALYLGESCTEIESTTRERARILANAFPGERCRNLTEAKAVLRQVRMHRNNSGYRRALFWARLILRSIGIDNGDRSFEKPIDERFINRAFESFIRKSLESELTGEAQVKKQRFHWNHLGRDPSSFVPIMETDATIIGRERCIVVDAKYYAEPLVYGAFGNLKFRSAHLYQIASYLRTLRRRDKKKRSWSACLIYAQKNNSFDYKVDLGDFNLRIVGIDLEENPNRILTKMRSIWFS